MRIIMVGKAKKIPVELPLPRKIVNQKQYCISGYIEKIGVRQCIKDLKDAGVAAHSTFSLNSYLVCAEIR